jgi:hypothetical protein
MQFDQLMALFRARRRMYVLDDRYYTLVAFIEGANCLLHPDSPLDGFEDWLGHRFIGRSSPLHWAVQITQFQFGENCRDLDPGQQEQACVAALDLIEEFRQTAQGIKVAPE